jgi:hypothetical protein
MDGEQKISGSGASMVRIAIGAHLAGVCVCAAFSILDRSAIGLPPDGSLLRLAVSVLLLTAFLEWFICPVTVLAVALRRGNSWQTAYSVLAEFVLCLSQIFALLPAYQ